MNSFLRTCVLLFTAPLAAPAANWPEYLGGPGRSCYSPLDQITPANVSRLRVAWEFHTGDAGQTQCNAIVVDGVLYGSTATNQIFALDAATGRELWRYVEPGHEFGSNQRGVTFWSAGNDRRVLFNIDEWLYAVDARTGQKIPGFGEGGRVSLRAGLGERARDKWVTSSSPGTIFENLIIMPSRVGELGDSAPGHVQAFDVRTGKLAWVFRTIPEPGEFGYETWPPDAHRNIDIGGANCWAGMAIDRARGIVFVPTGSAAPDFWGGARRGDNLFANCLLALDARTGRRRWHFQFVHHDIWDRDLPTPPTLLTVTHEGRRIDAVAQVTKSGHVFLFDRETGAALFPIEEQPAPQTAALEGETPAPTQPVPGKPAPFARQEMTEADLNPSAPNHASLLAEFRTFLRGAWQPISRQPTLIVPGLQGGAEWGGAAADERSVLYVNANELPYVAQLSDVPQTGGARLSRGQRLYMFFCIACHGPEKKGNPAGGMPSLVDLAARVPRADAVNLMTTGRNMMPGFTSLSLPDREAIAGWLYGDDEHGATGAVADAPVRDPAFEASAYAQFVDRHGYPVQRKFLDADGNPAIKPPWGTLNAIDLNTGETRWRVPLGGGPDPARPGETTGAENYGGPLVTAGGLVFIAATKDGVLRAYDRVSGKLVWRMTLPAAAFATPSTYMIGGHQYLVIACGGGKLGAPRGDSYVALALD
jgi:quinoprotein glucose dehydrogenase